MLLPITVQAYKAKVHEAAAKDSWYAGSTTPWLERVYGDAKRALPRAMSGRGSRGNLELGISGKETWVFLTLRIPSSGIGATTEV